MRTPKEEDIKVRVTLQMKSQLEAIANEREVSVSSICREAIREYLKCLGVNSPLAVEAAKIAQGAGHAASVISHEGVSPKTRKGLPLRGTSKRTSRGSIQQDRGQ